MSGKSMRGGAAALIVLGLGTVGLAFEKAIKETNSERRLMQEREDKLGAIRWDNLPWQWAITTVPGTGSGKRA